MTPAIAGTIARRDLASAYRAAVAAREQAHAARLAYWVAMRECASTEAHLADAQHRVAVFLTWGAEVPTD